MDGAALMNWSFGDTLIRTVRKNQKGIAKTDTLSEEEVWFVGKDVAQALGYKNTNDALANHVDEDDRMQGDGVAIRDPIGREQHPVIINESGVYSLIFGSKLEIAKEFKHWVTHEVLPEIRRTGAYTHDGIAKESTVGETYGGMAKLLASVASLHRQGIMGTEDARAAAISVFTDGGLPFLSMRERISALDALAARKEDVRQFIDEMLERSETNTDWKTLYGAYCAWAGLTLGKFGIPTERGALPPRLFTQRMKRELGIEGANADVVSIDGKAARGLRNWKLRKETPPQKANEDCGGGFEFSGDTENVNARDHYKQASDSFLDLKEKK